jgi:hypothetical protein
MIASAAAKGPGSRQGKNCRLQISRVAGRTCHMSQFTHPFSQRSAQQLILSLSVSGRKAVTSMYPCCSASHDTYGYIQSQCLIPSHRADLTQWDRTSLDDSHSVTHGRASFVASSLSQTPYIIYMSVFSNKNLLCVLPCLFDGIRASVLLTKRTMLVGRATWCHSQSPDCPHIYI